MTADVETMMELQGRDKAKTAEEMHVINEKIEEEVQNAIGPKLEEFKDDDIKDLET